MNQKKYSNIKEFIKLHGIIILCILQILFVIMYSDPEIQPFVYVRF